MTRRCVVGDVAIGPGRPLAVIAGPCLLESLELGLEVGRGLAAACSRLGLPYIFKASFDKANRTSAGSPRGPGMDEGLHWLDLIGRELGVPVTTDVHDPDQVAGVAKVVHLLQIPAFLCRQTDLLEAAGRAAVDSGGAVNVKKGQFLSPQEMAGPMGKLAGAGCENAMITERGTFFGYQRLVNDFTGLGDLLELDVPGGAPPVCFDCTHSVQTPGSGAVTGGRRERAELLARAAVASGVHALFLEVHPDPDRAQSDAATQLPIGRAVRVLEVAARIREVIGDGTA